MRRQARCSSQAHFQGVAATGTGRLASVLLTGAILLAGCAAEIDPAKKPTEESSATADQPQGIDGGDKPDPQRPSREGVNESVVQDSGASFQVKSATLLRNSIKSCFSDPNGEFLKVTADMLQAAPGDPALPDPGNGRSRFLLAGRYAENDDIISKESNSLVDPSKAGRTSVAADSLTDTYLRSLEVVANVVAHHCDLAANNTVCQCDTKSSARKLVERCLPSFDPNSARMDLAVDLIYLKCSISTAEEQRVKNMREAISSLLSSYAFAKAR